MYYIFINYAKFVYLSILNLVKNHIFSNYADH